MRLNYTYIELLRARSLMHDSTLGLGLTSSRGWLFSRIHFCNARIQSLTACGSGEPFISMVDFGGHSMGL